MSLENNGDPKETDRLLPRKDPKEDDPQTTSKCGACWAWLNSTAFLVYCSHGLSAWGDRMWQFATGLFLVELSPDSLRLTAIYGLTSGGAILLLGAIVGDWVDKNPRLRVARTLLIIQNTCVSLCAVVVCLLLYYRTEIQNTWDGWLETICHIFIIVFADIAQVASIGSTIAIQRDWIVVICGDKKSLTSMSAFLRRIDLTTNILAPVLTGQIMTFASMFIGAVVIAVWNIVSMIVEYYFLWRVYKSVPGLAFKNTTDKPREEEDEKEDTKKQTVMAESDYNSIDDDNHAKETAFTSKDKKPKDIDDNSTAEVSVDEDKKPPEKQQKGCCDLMFGAFFTLKRGWKTYINQTILFAGLGLSSLYMTVLGFDNITTGFAYQQGLSESIVSILMGVAAFFGIVGTLAFPKFRGWVGLERTGLYAFSYEIICLCACVASIWLPGSPFDPSFLTTGGQPEQSPSSLNMTTAGVLATMTTVAPPGKSMISIISLMAGIVVSRSGLWMADLTITQLLLEAPDEKERGIVNGVQSSINMFMNMLKFILVITLPWQETFGILILVSFCFIVMGFLCFCVYSRQQRGHILPFNNAFNEDAIIIYSGQMMPYALV